MSQKIVRLSGGADIICAIQGSHLGMASAVAAKKLRAIFVILPSAHPGQYGDDELNMRLYKKASIVLCLIQKEADFYIKNGVQKEKIFLLGHFQLFRTITHLWILEKDTRFPTR